MNAGGELIESIQTSGYQSVWAITGGGIGALHCMLGHPGASRFVLDVRVPYSSAALAEYLGEPPDSCCSEATARAMASIAFNHAARLTPRGALGVACAAALQTNRERKGADRAYICVQSAGNVVCELVELDPGTRAEQDAFVSGVLLSILSDITSRAG